MDWGSLERTGSGMGIVMKESWKEEEKYMEQFVHLLKMDIENFEAEPEQMKHFMEELLSRIKEAEKLKENQEGEDEWER